MTTTESPAQSSPFLQRLMQNTKASGAILSLLGILLAGVGLWRYFADKDPQWPVVIWCGALALCFLSGAVRLMIYQPASASADAVSSRTFILGLGGSIGLVTALFGLYLMYYWWADILMWMEMGGPDPARVERIKRVAAAWHVLWTLVALIGGLAIMLFSLQAARADIRTSPFLRQVLFGYNAFLTGLLLLMILVVANVWIGAKFPRPLDFTASSMYTLSTRSQGILRNLDRPVKVYTVLVPMDEDYDLVVGQVRTMLANCQEVTDKITYTELRALEDNDRLVELQKRLGKNLEPGLILEYDLGEDKKEKKYQQIRQEELSSRDSSGQMGQRDRAPIQFKGEDALISAINFLTEGKKATVYVTQGHGEPELRDRAPQGLGQLAERLEKRNFDVKPLKLGANPIPADAEVVIVPGPKETYSPAAVKSIDDYMNKKGRLFLMADLVLGPGNTPVPTGLEGILGKYGIELVNERLFGVDNSGRLPGLLPFILALGDDRSRNPVASQFSDPTRKLLLVEARPLRSAQSPMSMGRTTSQALLVQNPRVTIKMLGESNLALSNRQIIDRLNDNPGEVDRRIEAAAKFSLAMYATDGGMAPPPHPGLPPQPSGDQKPRMIVVGSSRMATNELVDPRSGTVNADFIASGLDWLREHEVNIGIGPKTVPVFTLPPEYQAGSSKLPLVLMPSLMIMLGIIGTGTGVWLVRRR